jgi:prepilin-type N-terminal cleavage/methylation domain-containing protein
MNGERGFSLIETLIALGLLVIGVLAVTTVFTEGRRVLGDAEHRRSAVWLGREKMEEKLGQAYEALVERVGDAERLDDGMLLGEDRHGGIIRVWTVESARPLPGMARVGVTTRWTERGVIRSFRIVGFKAQGRSPS